jgi:hypothetical protein
MGNYELIHSWRKRQSYSPSDRLLLHCPNGGSDLHNLLLKRSFGSLMHRYFLLQANVTERPCSSKNSI